MWHLTHTHKGPYSVAFIENGVNIKMEKKTWTGVAPKHTGVS